MASRVDGSDADPKIYVPPLTGAGPLGLAAAWLAAADWLAAALGGGAVVADGVGVAAPEHAANAIAAVAMSAPILNRIIDAPPSAGRSDDRRPPPCACSTAPTPPGA